MRLAMSNDWRGQISAWLFSCENFDYEAVQSANEPAFESWYLLLLREPVVASGRSNITKSSLYSPGVHVSDPLAFSPGARSNAQRVE